MGRAGGPPTEGLQRRRAPAGSLLGMSSAGSDSPKPAALGTPKLAAPSGCLPHSRAGPGSEELLVWVLPSHRARRTQGIVCHRPPPRSSSPGGFGVLAHRAQGKQETGSRQVLRPRQAFHCHRVPPRLLPLAQAQDEGLPVAGSVVGDTCGERVGERPWGLPRIPAASPGTPTHHSPICRLVLGAVRSCQ